MASSSAPAGPRLLCTFQEVSRLGLGVSIVGGKGHHLADVATLALGDAMASAEGAVKVKVPEGACVTTSAYVAHCLAAGVPCAKDPAAPTPRRGGDAGAGAATGADAQVPAAPVATVASASASAAPPLPPPRAKRAKSSRALIIAEAETRGVIDESVIATKDGLSQVRERIRSTPVQASLRAAVRAFLDSVVAEVGAGSWLAFAVRSSGTREDASDKSFAGQYDTVLNVPPNVDAVCTAIKDVWASQWNDHVQSYLTSDAGGALGGGAAGSGAGAGASGSGAGAAAAPSSRSGRPHSLRRDLDRQSVAVPRMRQLPHMAVVIQRQVSPSASGVLFTEAPLRAGVGLSVAEGVWGLGEAIVSGKVSPSQATAHWYTGRIVAQRLKQQKVKYVCAPQVGADGTGRTEDDWLHALIAAGEADEVVPGVLEVNTSDAEHDGSPLTPELMAQLCRVGRSIAAFYGRPQDIEWCAVFDGASAALTDVFVLQTRAVTVLTTDRSVDTWTLSLRDRTCAMGETLTGFGNVGMSALLAPANRRMTLRVRTHPFDEDAPVVSGEAGIESKTAADPHYGAVDIEAWAQPEGRGGVVGVSDMLRGPLVRVNDHTNLSGLRDALDGAIAVVYVPDFMDSFAAAAVAVQAAGAIAVAAVQRHRPGPSGIGTRLRGAVSSAVRSDASVTRAFTAVKIPCVAVTTNAAALEEAFAAFAAHAARRKGGSDAAGAGAGAGTGAGTASGAGATQLARLSHTDAKVFYGRSWNSYEVMQPTWYAETPWGDAEEWMDKFNADEKKFEEETNPTWLPMVPRLRELDDKTLMDGARTLVTGYGNACFHSWSQGHLAHNMEKLMKEECDDINADMGIEAAGEGGVDLPKLLKGVSARSALQRLEDVVVLHSRSAPLIEVARTYRAAVDDAIAEHTGPSGASGLKAATGAAARTALESIRTEPALAAVAGDVNAYLKEHYFMAEHDEDLAATNWADDPSFPVGVLMQLVLGSAGADSDGTGSSSTDVVPPLPSGTPASGSRSRGDSDDTDLDIPAPPTLVRGATSMYVDERARLESMLGDADGFWDRLDELRGYLRGKEHAHLLYVKTGYLTKHFCAELGRRWAERGLLQPGFKSLDMLHTHWVDLIDTLDGLLTVREFGLKVDAGATYERMWRKFPIPSAVVGGRQVEASKSSQQDDGSDDGGAALAEALRKGAADGAEGDALFTLDGDGCSAGKLGAVTGVARVITDLAHAGELRKGDVLITRETLPAWTPLFSIISALVMEEGGMLSHGAVVARECGIPAVSNIKKATRIIKTGTRVHVDGLDGRVSVLELPEGADAAEEADA